MNQSGDERYEALAGRYRAVVQERDELQGRVKRAEARAIHLEGQLDKASSLLSFYQGKELVAITCDNKCGRAVVGEDMTIIAAEAARRRWFSVAINGVRRDLCELCHKELQTTPI